MFGNNINKKERHFIALNCWDISAAAHTHTHTEPRKVQRQRVRAVGIHLQLADAQLHSQRWLVAIRQTPTQAHPLALGKTKEIVIYARMWKFKCTLCACSPAVCLSESHTRSLRSFGLSCTNTRAAAAVACVHEAFGVCMCKEIALVLVFGLPRAVEIDIKCVQFCVYNVRSISLNSTETLKYCVYRCLSHHISIYYYLSKPLNENHFQLRVNLLFVCTFSFISIKKRK